MSFKLFYPFIFVCCLIYGCNRIQSADTLSPETMHQLKAMGLLNTDEGLVYFYSNYKEEVAGNIITNQRLAHYWIDVKDSSQTEIQSAYYSEMVNIVDHFQVPDFDCPYLEVTKTDGTQLRVYLDGDTEAKQQFYQTALKLWKQALKK